MTPSHPHRRVAGILLIASLAIACGGGGGGASGSPAAGASAATSAGNSSSTIEISGAATGTISQPGGCGKAVSDETSWEVSFQTDDGGWMLDATIEGTLKPGTYQTGFHTPGAVSVLLYQGGGGTSFDSATGSGSITVDGGGDSGSIDVTVTDRESGKTAKAVGGWTCET
jgi:hypothetical protein